MHPNASASGIASAAVAIGIYAAHRFGFNGLTSEDAVVIAGAANGIVLWIGRRGLKAALTSLWKGWAGAPKTNAKSS